MKCPYCGSRFAGERQYCPNCKQPISRARPQAEAPERPAVREDPRRRGLRRALITAAALVCAFLVCLGIYKLTFWIGSYRVNRLYTRGEYTPTVNTVTMDDGRVGHTIVFYGSDGDQIFLPELQKSLSISGGVARVTIADSDWFSGDVTDVEAANVRLSPMLVDERGSRTQLPEIAFTVEVPDSPLTVLSPAEDGLNVVTARYPLDLQVVPGSTVIVNGEDVTDTVSRSGELDQTVNVYPIGDNTYTIIVRTPQHHETRHEVTIHREKYDIEFELDTSVATTSDAETMTVKGKIEPGASITVETDYIAESLLLDRETGEFSFIAQLSSFGENLIRFRVQMDGRQDAVIRLNVQYRPTLAKCSADGLGHGLRRPAPPVRALDGTGIQARRPHRGHDGQRRQDLLHHGRRNRRRTAADHSGKPARRSPIPATARATLPTPTSPAARCTTPTTTPCSRRCTWI